MEANQMMKNRTNEEANPHAGHRQRMRERFLREGLEGFEAHEALELLLYYAIPYKDTNPIAHRLIERFGSLAGVLEADYADLSRFPALGASSALLLKLIPQISQKYVHDRWKARPKLDDVETAAGYAGTLFVGKTYEEFHLICLDAQNRVNHAVKICDGTLNEAAVYPRLIVENALRHRANSVIFTHNHPGGSTRPSKADVEITRRLKKALEAISINVADHIVVAGPEYASFAEQGLL